MEQTSLVPVFTGVSSFDLQHGPASHKRTVHSHRKSFQVPKQVALAIRQSIGSLPGLQRLRTQQQAQPNVPDPSSPAAYATSAYVDVASASNLFRMHVPEDHHHVVMIPDSQQSGWAGMDTRASHVIIGLPGAAHGGGGQTGALFPIAPSISPPPPPSPPPPGAGRVSPLPTAFLVRPGWRCSSHPLAWSNGPPLQDVQSGNSAAGGNPPEEAVGLAGGSSSGNIKVIRVSMTIPGSQDLPVSGSPTGHVNRTRKGKRSSVDQMPLNGKDNLPGAAQSRPGGGSTDMSLPPSGVSQPGAPAEAPADEEEDVAETPGGHRPLTVNRYSTQQLLLKALWNETRMNLRELSAYMSIVSREGLAWQQRGPRPLFDVLALVRTDRSPLLQMHRASMSSSCFTPSTGLFGMCTATAVAPATSAAWSLAGVWLAPGATPFSACGSSRSMPQASNRETTQALLFLGGSARSNLS